MESPCPRYPSATLSCRTIDRLQLCRDSCKQTNPATTQKQQPLNLKPGLGVGKKAHTYLGGNTGAPTICSAVAVLETWLLVVLDDADPLLLEYPMFTEPLGPGFTRSVESPDSITRLPSSLFTVFEVLDICVLGLLAVTPTSRDHSRLSSRLLEVNRSDSEYE
jgi:hypothetical protein